MIKKYFRWQFSSIKLFRKMLLMNIFFFSFLFFLFSYLIYFQVQYLRNRFPSLRKISVDGGINVHTGIISVRAGASALIAGTTIFGRNRFRERGSDVQSSEEKSEIFVKNNFELLKNAVNKE